MSEANATALSRSLATQAAAYPGPVSRIEMLETHISWVFLAGEFAYKVKKPVDLGFVNFSTLERRRQFCDEELRLNRRLAPELYLDVLPIAGSAESPRIGGEGAAIEYCVRMRRFEQDRLLSRLVAEGKLLPRHIDSLARQVAEFHARIPVAEPASRFGTPEAVAEPMRANFAHLDRLENAAANELVERLRSWTEQELAAREDQLIVRKRNGFVRECHGDMHLGNMILADSTHSNDAITIFDCIEFNPDLRWIDVASEVAFCTMDLEDRGRADLARRFLNAYLEWSGDYTGLSVFRLYFVYRALVRAKVAQLRRVQGGLSSGESERLARELSNYLELAERSTRRPAPFLAVTHGLSGSGKTWGSQAVVERFGAIRVRSDIERKRLAGLGPLADTVSGVGSGLYSSAFSRQTFAKLVELAAAIIAAGFSTVVDATFLKRAERDQFRTLAAKLKVPFLILEFPADEATCRERIRRRMEERIDASEATEAVLEHQLQVSEPLAEEERPYVVSFGRGDSGEVERGLDRIEALRR